MITWQLVAAMYDAKKKTDEPYGVGQTPQREVIDELIDHAAYNQTIQNRYDLYSLHDLFAVLDNTYVLIEQLEDELVEAHNAAGVHNTPDSASCSMYDAGLDRFGHATNALRRRFEQIRDAL